MTRLIAPLAALLLATTGCVVQRDFNSPGAQDAERFEFYSNFSNSAGDGVDLGGGSLAGDMGSMRNFDGAATLSGYHGGDWTDVEVILQNNRGAAMAYLTFDGGIQSLQPGQTYTFDEYGYNSDGPNLYGYACSGDEVYNWDWDVPMETVEVTAEGTDDPDVVVLNFTADHNGQQSTGAIEYSVR